MLQYKKNSLLNQSSTLYSLIKKLNRKIINPCKYTTFLTIDDNYISGLVYKHSSEEVIGSSIVCQYSSNVTGVKFNTICSKTELAYSIAKCIDYLEEKISVRIKNVILNLIGFNAKSTFYELHLSDITKVKLHNLGRYINFREVGCYLGNDYIVTNLLPLSISNVKKNNYTPLKFVVAGFKREFISIILDIFYNLSLTIDSILFAPLLLPYALKEPKKSIIFLSSNYTLLHSQDSIEVIPFGTNYILESISKTTYIPYSYLIKYNNIVKELLTVKDQTLLYRIDDFVIKNVNQVITSSLKEFFTKFKYLITRKNLHKHGKIIIINNNLKFFKEHNLLSVLNTLNIEFSNITCSKNSINLEVSISEILNKAAINYYYGNMLVDLALKNFNKRIKRILEY